MGSGGMAWSTPHAPLAAARAPTQHLRGVAPLAVIPKQRQPEPAPVRRVVVAHDYVTQRGGAERVVLAMLAAFPGAPLHTTIYNPSSTFPEFAQHDVRSSWLTRVAPLREDPRKALPLLAPVVSRTRIDADVVLASSSGWAHGFRGDCPTVVYCHNPARWLYQRADYAHALGRPARTALSVLAPALRGWDRRAARSATAYLANSTSVQRRIEQTYGVRAEVLHPPSSLDPDGEQEPVPGLEPGFLLTVARARAYKNSVLACEAVAGMPGQRLVVVGGLSLDRAWPDNVIGLTGVPDAQLRWLYAHAKAVVAVSHEDFGLTPVEGYAMGTPSVVLRAGGYLDSSVEGTTSVFIDDVRPESIADGVRALVARPWDSAAIRLNARRFSRERFAARLHEVVDAVV